MRYRSAIALAAVLALAVPGQALAHKDKADKKRDAPKSDLDHFKSKWSGKKWQTWTLGDALHLTGFGKIAGSVQQPVADATSSAVAEPTRLRAYRGKLKVYAISDSVEVECTGRGYKRTKMKNGHLVTTCKHFRSATITGGDFMFTVKKAKAAQAWVPAGLSGEIATKGFFWSGDMIPDDPADIVLGEKPDDDHKDGHKEEEKSKSDSSPS